MVNKEDNNEILAALDHEQVRAVAHSERSNAMLKLECRARSIVWSQNRTVVLFRLAEFHAGRLTMNKSLIMPMVNAPPPNDFFVVEHQRAPVFATGEMQLLGLPHEVLRYFMNFLPHADLLSLLFCGCRYLHEDARRVLQARALALFGSQGTILALSAVVFYDAMLAAKLTRPAYKLKPVSSVGSAWNTVKRKMERQGLYISYAQGTVTDYIRVHIAAKGAVENIYRDRVRRTTLAESRAKEAAYLQRGAQERFAECIGIFERAQFPRLFVWTEEQGFKWLPIYFALDALEKFDSSVTIPLRHVRAYILQGGERHRKMIDQPFTCSKRMRLVLDCLASLSTFNPKKSFDFYYSPLGKMARMLISGITPDTNIQFTRHDYVTKLFARLDMITEVHCLLLIFDPTVDSLPTIMDANKLFPTAFSSDPAISLYNIVIGVLQITSDHQIYIRSFENLCAIGKTDVNNFWTPHTDIIWITTRGYTAPLHLKEYEL